MSKNFKMLLTVILVLATTITFVLLTVCLQSKRQNNQDNYVPGIVDLRTLANVIGGGAESINGCYRKINPDCGGIGGKPDRLCPAFANACGERMIYYNIHESRAKHLLESKNTLQGYDLPEQKCYESKACDASEIVNTEYNGNASNPGCVTKSGMLCYACSNPNMNNPTINSKSDYRCNDP